LLCQADGHPLDDGQWDVKGTSYRVFLHGEWIVVPADTVISGPNKLGKAVVGVFEAKQRGCGAVSFGSTYFEDEPSRPAAVAAAERRWLRWGKKLQRGRPSPEASVKSDGV
jgi:hypothetical protein